MLLTGKICDSFTRRWFLIFDCAICYLLKSRVLHTFIDEALILNLRAYGRIFKSSCCVDKTKVLKMSVVESIADGWLMCPYRYSRKAPQLTLIVLNLFAGSRVFGIDPYFAPASISLK